MPDRPVPKIYAHRGVSAVFPENTIAAFSAARGQGADGVELDVRRSADGRLVVHHDARLRDGRAIISLTRGEIPSAVPTLEEALEACGDLIVNIEIKNLPGEPDFDADSNVAAQVARVVRSLGRVDSVIVSSFNHGDIARSQATDADIATGWLVLEVPDPGVTIGHVVQGRHLALHPPLRAVTPDLVSTARLLGVQVNVWTVDSPTEIVELAELGVDGVITNDPGTAREVLDRWRSASA